MKITKGQLLAITQGAYSDYGFDGAMRAARDFDSDEVFAAYKESETYKRLTSGDTEYHGRYSGGDGFLPWSMREGYLTPCEPGEIIELYVGDYGGFEPSVRPVDPAETECHNQGKENG